MTKGLIQTGKNGEITWEVNRRDQESGPSGKVGLPVCNSLEDLMNRTFASDLVEIWPLIARAITELL